MAEVLTRPKTKRTFTVLSDALGIHWRPDGSPRDVPVRGEQITTDDLPPGCDVERLLALQAISPTIALPTDPESGLPMRPKRREPKAPPAAIVEVTFDGNGPRGGFKFGQPKAG